jgi:RNA polymerase sigma-70 factor (ECF subfamily)
MTDANDTSGNAGTVFEDTCSESAMLSRLRASDERAFEMLVRQHTPRLMRVAARFLRSEEDCADAVQDTFVRAFRALRSFEGKSQLSTWLHRIVVNTCLMRLRSRSRAVSVSLDQSLQFDGTSRSPRREPTAAPGPAESLLTSAETRDQVRACVERLPEQYRMVIVLRDLEERNTEQVARSIGTTQAVVKTRLHRARRALRTLLESLVAL